MKYNNLIIFDLDGVLVDTKEVHYLALNEAIYNTSGEDYIISPEEHVTTYDGLPTKSKLELLRINKGLPASDIPDIIIRKKKYTSDVLDEEIILDHKLISIMRELKKRDYKIAVASNAIRETVVTCLVNLGIMKYVDYFASNEDVNLKKPHPEIYWKCMTILNAIPETTLIVEDSAVGREGALNTGAKLITVKNSSDLSWDKIERKINLNKAQKQKVWVDDQLTVLIPMAGAGSRFAQQGYTFPKPLIEVRGKPMIQLVVENLGIKANYIFIVQKEHYEKYNLQYLLNLIAPGCKIVQVDGLTEGAACTTLLAKEYIDNDRPLLIANSDQFMVWNPSETMYVFSESELDGGILTFHSTHPKWSYAKTDENGFVIEVAEKKPISENATTGVYYWKKGSDYVRYATDMILGNDRVNNEFYVCPVFNHAIQDGKRIRIFPIEKMYGIGTPEDLNYFLNNYENEI